MGSRVRIEVASGIATVTLTRADKRNALDLDMITAIVDGRRSDAAARCQGRSAVR